MIRSIIRHLDGLTMALAESCGRLTGTAPASLAKVPTTGWLYDFSAIKKPTLVMTKATRPLQAVTHRHVSLDDCSKGVHKVPTTGWLYDFSAIKKPTLDDDKHTTLQAVPGQHADWGSGPLQVAALNMSSTTY
jgi:hypothetical protein